jgi:hypothetical protein
VLDVIKGSVIYHASVPAAGDACDVQATLTENWLVYHYFDDELPGVGQSKGYRVVSVEFYEGNGPDEKTRRLVSAYSHLTLQLKERHEYLYKHKLHLISKYR